MNGFAGIDFQQDDLTLSELRTAARGLREAACTRWLLTLITGEWSRLLDRARHLHGIVAADAGLRSAVAGWHIEGPFLSAEPGFCGAHNPALMCDPTPGHLEALREALPGDPILITLAPERPGSMESIRAAVRLGMRVNLGHTNASADQLREAVVAGATGFTHLGNGCPQHLDRHDNILWRVLCQPSLAVSLIPDGIHVSPSLMTVLHRSLPRESIHYVSDAMSAGGAPPGRYRLGAWELEVGGDQIVRRPGTTQFAGSALRPVDGVFRAAAMTGAPWQESWLRFSDLPARRMGLEPGLAVGAPAEFCLLRVDPQGRLTHLEVVGA
ncbi:MAG TPA: N-acetylglucosamine-6-phosphate deacetylase [Verrucomicrobiales bacterium]|nr:N-acetylglucosamine-6-phosphate deacetylase [Verrucomicrobiales bacterium]